MAENMNADCVPVQENVVRQVRGKMLSQAYISRSASFFKTVGDETRMKILYALSCHEMCVNDVAVAVNMTKSAVSHQLKLLKTEGLVKNRREGKNIFYSLDDQHVVEVLRMALEHVGHKLNEKEEH